MRPPPHVAPASPLCVNTRKSHQLHRSHNRTVFFNVTWHLMIVSQNKPLKDVLPVFSKWPSRREHPRAGGMRTQGFKSVKAISSNMLAIAIGAFQRLATGFDAEHRRISLWAPPGAAPADARVPWQILSNATAAWANFTGQPLPALGKLDMLVSGGPSPWSSSQHGLLLMDRFGTLWNSEQSSATDLVRCAHVICHETGHLWLGGLLQTLNYTGRMFMEESTTSYGEVFCVSRVLGGPLSQRAAFERSFFPAFGDTRALHNGAAFHAVENLARPAGAGLQIEGGPAAYYTKGAALLHMLESYADAVVGPVVRADQAWESCRPCGSGMDLKALYA